MTMAEVLIPARFSAATHAGPDRRASLLRLDGETMGTRWSVQLASRAADGGAALRAGIETRLAQLVDALSHWLPESSLCRWNRAAAGSRVPLPEDFATVLDAALAIAEASDGALDPTLGALVDLWGYGPPGPRAGQPGAAEIAAARARCGWRRLLRDGDTLLQPGGVQLDFSAIAKGHAVDVIAGWLDRAGQPHHLVEIGGELRGQGVKPDGQPWWVEIEDSRPPGRIALDGLSVATSGNRYRRHAPGDAHTLDPRSGAPLADAPDSVTVIHPLCREADGWATALTVLGPVDGLRLADRRGLAARWVCGREIVVSSGWQALRDP
jgi:thiamine biosynthesis lipoprotein